MALVTRRCDLAPAENDNALNPLGDSGRVSVYSAANEAYWNLTAFSFEMSKYIYKYPQTQLCLLL
jgi:hypothetical protein